MHLFREIIFTLFGFSLFFNALFFIPQAIKIYRTKQAHGFSKIMFVGFCLSQLTAVIYGYMKPDWILMIGFAGALVTCGTVTVLIFIYSKPPKSK